MTDRGFHLPMAAFLVAGSTLFAGCASRGNVELLEARLRQQEEALLVAQHNLEDARGELRVAQQANTALRDQIAANGKQPLLPEQADRLYRVESIEFNSLLSSGVDRDGEPGDERLTAVIAPVDADGELVKLPGKLELEVLDLSRPAGRQQIGRWSYDYDESSTLWHGGFLASGYQVDVPWQEVPQSDEVVVHATFTTPDNRQFDTTETIKIDPPSRNRAPRPLRIGARLDELDDINDPPPRPVRPAAGAVEEPEPEPPAFRPIPTETSDSYRKDSYPRLR